MSSKIQISFHTTFDNYLKFTMKNITFFKNFLSVCRNILHEKIPQAMSFLNSEESEQSLRALLHFFAMPITWGLTNSNRDGGCILWHVILENPASSTCSAMFLWGQQPSKYKAQRGATTLWMVKLHSVFGKATCSRNKNKPPGFKTLLTSLSAASVFCTEHST